jgi:hypothetical protein
MTAMELPPSNWGKPVLLTRDKFRELVFARDGYKCVFCQKEAKDAHHIFERRLWNDGGYYLDNGASVCHECHYKCEQTTYTVEQVREAAKIRNKIYPDCLYSDRRYDKWGNEYIDTDLRSPGPLYWDEGVSKVLVGNFLSHVKYPRTLHLPWSKFVDDDDKMIKNTNHMEGREVVVTEKLDGENTTIYRDYLHARSLSFSPHSSRGFVKALASNIGWQLPNSMRICGENVTAVHTIRYTNLATYFYVFSIWEGSKCLSWDDTLEWCELLDLVAVPVFYKGIWDIEIIKGIAKTLTPNCEGYVVRPVTSFQLSEFKDVVLKYRGIEITGNHNWMAKQVEFNEFKQT